MHKNGWLEFLDRYYLGDIGADELKAWREERFSEVIAYVAEKSRFYNRHFSGLKTQGICSSDITALPRTTKEHLHKAMYDMLCGDVRESHSFYSTTGTTGVPTPCPRSDLDVEVNNTNVYWAIRKILEKHFDHGYRPVIASFAPNELHSVNKTMAAAAVRYGACMLDVFPLSPVMGFERCLKVLQETRADVLLCSPGLLMSVAELSEAYGINVCDDLNVRVLLCTGEICSPIMRQQIEDTWGATVYDFMYGSQESMVMAAATTANQLKMVLPCFYFEVLPIEGDGSEKFNGKNGLGELCTTALIPGMKPLIRYRTGDVVHVSGNDANDSFITVLGRVKDLVSLNGQMFTPLELEQEILHGDLEIFNYQLAISTRDDADFVFIKVKPRDEVDHQELKARVLSNIHDRLGVAGVVEIHPVVDLQSATGGWVSWKAARIVDGRDKDKVSPIPGIESSSAAQLSAAARTAI